MNEQEKHYPYPEMSKGNRGAGWKVQPNLSHSDPAYINPSEGIIRVPVVDTCVLCGERHGASIRLHEEGHIRFTLDTERRTPRQPKGLSKLVWECVEDVRMDLCQQSTGIPSIPSLCEYERPRFIGEYKQFSDLARVLWATATFDADRPLVETVVRAATAEDKPEEARLKADEILNITSQVRQMLTRGARMYTAYDVHGVYTGSKPRPSLRQGIQVAQWLQNLLVGSNVMPPPGSEKQKGDSDAEEETEEGDEETSYDPQESLPQAEQEQAEEDEEAGRDPALTNPNPHASGSGWGEMDIEEVPLVRALPGRLVEKWRATDEGYIPGGMHRWMTDHKVFRTRRRVNGGTLLVDCSGSMALRAWEVYKIMEAVPGVLVAAYSGNGQRGWLRIIAKEGRVTSEEFVRTPGGANTVDGPALQWLGLQEPVRVWLSDGFVNGKMGSWSEDLYFDRDMLVARNRIVHVDSTKIPREKLGQACVDAMLRKYVKAAAY